MINILGLALYGAIAASHRVRLSQYCSGLLDANINLHIHALLDNRYLASRLSNGTRPISPIIGSSIERLKLLLKKNRFDAAIVHCELFPLMPGWLEASLLRFPFIYDFDDAFYLRYRSTRLALLSPLLNDKFDRIISNATIVTAGNAHLANYAKTFNSNVMILPSAVNTDMFRPKSKKSNTIFTIGWIGSPSTAKYLEILIDPLQKIGESTHIRLIVVGGKGPTIPNIEVLEVEWSENTEVDLINSFDVGVMPLPDDEWTRGKCAYKLVQYMACGIPVVGSRVGANIELVTHDCGFLVDTSQQWIDALTRLHQQPELRQKMGDLSRERIVRHYSLHNNLPILAQAIQKTIQSKKVVS
jgi:glycosyltransferase involved in cell wall biosynthesis